MRTALLSLAVIVTIGAIIVFVGPLLISTEHVRGKAFARVEAATGYRLRVSGPVKVAFFPSLDLVAEDVGIAQPKASGAAEFATARALRLGLRLGPLLSGKVRMTDVTLVDPIVTLPLPSRPAPDAPGNGEGGPDDRVRVLSLDRLVIRNGTVVLPASGGKPGEKITGLMLEASLPSSSGPLAFEGAADYDGDKFKTTGSIGSFVHFLSGGPAPIRLTVEAPAYLPEGATLSTTVTYKDATLTLAQLAARSGKHALAGNAIYQDQTLSITQGTLDNTPFAGSAHLGDDTLTVDARAAIEGKPVRVTGVTRTFDRFLAGDAAPIQLTIDAPDYLPAEAAIAGTVMYKDDTFVLTEFTATSGEDTLSGAAAYRDDVLSLSQVTATVGGETITGDATYRDDAIELDVTVGLDGKPAKVIGSIAEVDKLLNGEPTPIKLAIDAPDHLPAKASVEGGASYKDGAVVLTAFTAVSGDYRLTGNGTYKDDTLVLDPIRADTGSEILSGAATVKLGDDVPNIGATLTATSTGKAVVAAQPADEAPKAQEAPPKKTKSRPAQSPLASPPGTESETPAAADAPKTALATPPGGETEIAVAPPVAGESAPETPAPDAAPRTSGFGWRVEKLRFLALKDVNADVTLTLDQFVYEGIRIGAGTVKATLSGGKLTAEASSLKAYGGGGSVTLVIDASGETPAHQLKVSLADLDAYSFQRDSFGFRTIEGKAVIALDLTASGASEHDLVSSLNGTAQLNFTEGALRGLNVASMLRNLTTGILTGWQYKEEAKTVFNKLGANFNIINGQAQTDDLRMIGPLVSMGGAGTVDLHMQRLKFRVNPFMLASVEGGDGKNSRLGFPVPIAVSGPWDRPSFYPDIPGILETPVAAYQQLNKLGGGLIAMPAGLLGIDTGEGGLVEKGVAIPTAITKGVVGGIGQVLGIKKPESAPPQGDAAAPGETAAPPEGEASAPPAAPTGPEQAPTDAPKAAATKPDSASRAETAAPETAAQASPKKEKASEAAPNQMLENMFDN